MIIATFGPSTGWNGKSITYDGRSFILEDHGPITAQAVLDYDRQGHLTWASDTARELVQTMAGAASSPAVTTPPVVVSPAADPAGPVTQAKKRRRWPKVLGITLAVLIILGIIGAIVSPPEDENTAATQSAVDTSVVETTQQSTPTPTATAAATPTPTAEPAEPVVKPKVYSGSGNRITKIKKPSGSADEPAIATISHNGQSNFAVWTLDKKLKQEALLVNTIGDYKGTVALDFEEGSATSRIQFEADGAWKMTIRPVTDARRFSNKTKGQGDDVVHYTGGPKVATITHSGSSNFAVWFYGDDGMDLLVNDIGKYKGQSPFSGEAIIVITADGTWTITAK